MHPSCDNRRGRPAQIYSIPKNPDEPQFNEDAWTIDACSGRLVLSDGASESFDSRSWARLLTESAQRVDLSAPDCIATILEAALAQYRDLYTSSELSWSKQLAFERGSFASLLACHVLDDGRALELICVGDSLALLLDGERPVRSFAYQFAEQFLSHPVLLSSRADLNAEILSQDQEIFRSRVDLRAVDARWLLMMTDALGAWVLQRVEENALSEVLALTAASEQNFQEFVLEEREAGRMRVDDTTLAIVDLRCD